MPWAKQGCAHQINKHNWVNVQFSPAKFRKCFSFHQHLVLRHLVLHQNSRQRAGSEPAHPSPASTHSAGGSPGRASAGLGGNQPSLDAHAWILICSGSKYGTSDLLSWSCACIHLVLVREQAVTRTFQSTGLLGLFIRNSNKNVVACN